MPEAAALKHELEEAQAVAAALADSRKRLALALKVSQMGTWEIDLVAGALTWSPECYELTGVASFHGAMKAFKASTHPEDRRVVTAAINDALRRRESFAAEFRLRRADGVWRWFATRGQAEYHEDGIPVRMYGTVQDVTDSRSAQEGLRASEERFRQLAESIQEVFWLTDVAKSEVVYVSPGYETIWGRTCESLYGNPSQWLEAIHPEDRARVERALAGQQSAAYDEEYRIVRPDGEVRWIRDRAFPVVGSDGGVIRVAGVAEDITQHRELEAQLRHSQKMQSIGELAGGVAHDFNNLLTVISTASELLEMTLPAGHEGRELVEEIRLAQKRASSLTRQLLAFSRKEVVEPRTVSLDEVVLDTEKMLRRLLGEDIALSSELHAPGAYLRIDPGQFVQVLMNLAVNARDAMPLGGRLVIETCVVPASADAPERVRVTLSDTGHGMTDDVKSRIFEPFFTTKGSGAGTGMGLSVVHGIVQQSGGTIAVTSQTGFGSRFEIEFPCVPFVPASAEESAATPRGKGTILVVEDDPNLRRLVERALSAQGYTVISAATPGAALDVVMSDRPLHLLFTDLVMPETDGRTLAAEATRVRPGLRVLYTSGYTDDAIVRHGVQQAEVAFLRKPYSLATLAGRVQEAMTS